MIDLLKRYYKVFFSEHYNYVVDKPIDDVLAETRELLTSKKPLLGVPNITGRITKYSFEATPSWSFLIVRGGFDRNSAHIKGDLVADGPSVTRVELAVRPNLNFFITYISFNVIGAVCIIFSVDVKNLDIMMIEPVLGGIAFIIASHTLIWGVALLSKKFLRETFQDAMGILPVASDVSGS